MKNSLYAQYLLERESAHLLQYDWGFAVYKLEADHVYLQDIFVLPEERKSGKGIQLMNEVAAIARQHGLKTMVGSVAPSTPFANSMIKIMMGLQFRLASSQDNIIYMVKEI